LAKYKYDELVASDALLLGRITYEAFAAAWPTMEEIEGDFAVRMNALPKYVAQTTLEKADWKNPTISRENAPEGGGRPSRATLLQQHTLIDEIRMLVHPIAVGTGKRLFDGANESVAFQLVDT